MPSLNRTARALGAPSRPRSRKAAGLRREAALRGFGYLPTLDGPGLPGLLFRAGSRVRASDLVDARASATPFLAGSVIGQYADDSSIPRTIAGSFVAIPLPSDVPNIVLLGKGLGILRQAGVSLAGHQRLSLEGDFDRSFTLHCPAGYERDALYIFAPDLMQLLVDTTARCDVELVDGWMFVYSAPGRYRDAGAIDGLVRTTERVQDKLRRQTSRYSDDRSARLAPATGAAPRTVSPEEHAAHAGSVAAGGRRLRTRASLVQRLVTLASWALLVFAAVYLAVAWLPALLAR